MAVVCFKYGFTGAADEAMSDEHAACMIHVHAEYDDATDESEPPKDIRIAGRSR